MWLQQRFVTRNDLLDFLNGTLRGTVDISEGAAVDGLTFVLNIGAGDVTTTFAPAKGRPWTIAEMVAEINTTMAVDVVTIHNGIPDPRTRSVARSLLLSYDPPLTVDLTGTANALLGFSAAVDTVQVPIPAENVLSVDFEIENAQHLWCLTYNDAGVGTGGDMNLEEIAGSPVDPTTIPGTLPVVGTVAHDAVDDNSEPVKVGGTVRVVLPTLANGDRAGLSTDANTQLRVRPAAYDPLLAADQVAVINEERNAVDNFALNIDEVNIAISTVSRPSDSGLEMDGYRILSLSGKLIIAAGGTITLTIEGTNDEDATPINRDWKTLFFKEQSLGAIVNQIVCVAATTTFAITLREDEANWRYLRVRLVVAGSAVNTVVIKGRRIP